VKRIHEDSTQIQQILKSANPGQDPDESAHAYATFWKQKVEAKFN